MTGLGSQRPHQHPPIENLGPYVRTAVAVMRERGLQVPRYWLDPCDPRDATVVYVEPSGDRLMAAVYDEVAGWRYGRYVSGRDGDRTVVEDVRHVGGGVLPDPADVAAGIMRGLDTGARVYRHHTEVADGYEEALATYGD